MVKAGMGDLLAEELRIKEWINFTVHEAMENE